LRFQKRLFIDIRALNWYNIRVVLYKNGGDELIRFSETENGVSLLNNDTEVFSFRVGDSPIAFGKAVNTYKMSHGSFRISEKTAELSEQKIQNIELQEKKLTVHTPNGAAELSIIKNKRLGIHLTGFNGFNRMYLKIPARKDEHVYGTGEIFPELDLRGKKVNCWVAEHINALQIGKKLIRQTFGIRNTTRKQRFSNYETYYAQPTFISSEKYYYHSLSTARCEFDFSHPDYHLIKTDSVSDFTFGFADDFEQLLSDMTELLGRQPELPDWVYDGQIIASQGGSEEMLKHYRTAKEHGLEVNGIWIQDWEGRRVTAVGKQLFWNWEWDRELYPDLDKIIKELNAEGVKVLGYCNPFLAVEKPLYKYASEHGYCVKDRDGKDYLVTITTFPAAMIDLSNKEAYDWMKGIIKKNMIDFGLSGWMADFGEYLPTDCVLASGEDAETVHNVWPARWARLNREAVEESGKLGEIFFFTRAGYTDTLKQSLMMWNGDNHVDFSIDFGLPSVIPAALSLTCCGFGLSHSDIGGYTTFFNLKRSEELYMRWCEMNAFTPLMRGHEGLNPELNAQFDASEAVLSQGAKFGKVHKALKPYLKEAVKYNSEKGVGVIRPLFFYYDEEKAYTEAYEYLLGRDILVAPVIREKAQTRMVYLPDDEWIHLWSGREYSGGETEVAAPVGEIPVFIRKNSPVRDELLNIKNI